MIKNLDRKFLVWALGYLVIGMGLGLYMAASHHQEQRATHTHILLVGFALSLIYAVIHKLWLGDKPSTLAGAQFLVHQGGAVAMGVGLFLLYGNVVPAAQIDPLLAVASITAFLAALLMMFLVLTARPARK